MPEKHLREPGFMPIVPEVYLQKAKEEYNNSKKPETSDTFSKTN